MMTVSASAAGAGLEALIRQARDDRVAVRISSPAGEAVLMPAEDYDSWQETAYLLRSPANALRLLAAVARDREGQPGITKTLEEPRSLADRA